MRAPRFLASPVCWLPAAYLGLCAAALLVVLSLTVLVPARSKFIALWLLVLSLPWSDYVLSGAGATPWTLWGGVLAGIALNAAVLLCAGLAARWLIRALARRADSP